MDSIYEEKKPYEYTIKEYTIKTNSCDEFQVSLPLPSDLEHLINQNTQKDLVKIDKEKYLSFFESETIDLTSNNFIENMTILKSLCAFLGSVNMQNDFSQITDEEGMSNIMEDQCFDKVPNFLTYVEKNKVLFFYYFKLKQFNIFINALEAIGITITQSKDNALYQSMKKLVISSDQIMIIVSPSNNFWIKSQQSTINGVNYDRKLNHYTNIFFNLDFVNKFMKRVGNHPRCFLGLINSMVLKNLKSTVDALKIDSNLFPKEYVLFDQTMHLVVNESNDKKGKKEFQRDMEKILHVIKTKKKEFDVENIIILESEPDKINENTRDNTIRMNLFSEQFLTYDQEDKEKFIKYQDEILDYLEKLLENCTDDVREYLVKYPMKFKK